MMGRKMSEYTVSLHGFSQASKLKQMHRSVMHPLLMLFAGLATAEEGCEAMSKTSRSLAMVQTRHHLTANESIHGVEEEPVKSNKSNQSHNESSHGTWIGKAWQKVENATASVAHAVSEVGQEAWNGTKEAWNSTKGMAEKLWDGNHSAKKSDDAGNTSADEVTKSKTCFTVKTEADSWFTKVAAAGSHCVFGVDTLDEGYHCIEQGGDFGPNGWCWTSKDRSAWGRCSDDCPLTGPQKVLAEKLDNISGKLDNISAALKR